MKPNSEPSNFNIKKFITPEYIQPLDKFCRSNNARMKDKLSQLQKH